MDSLIELNKNNFWNNRQPPTESLIKTAQLFDKINGKVIIEIGTGIQGEMSGNSALVWANKTNAEYIYCLDLEQKHIDQVNEAVKGKNAVIALKIDGFEFLKNFEGSIDMLYLDFWVEDKPDEVQGTGRAEHYLRAFELAKNKMNKKSIILIDDTDHIDQWKHTYIVPEARKHGYQVLWCGRQTCLFRKE
jgi:predicted O-methyltransferase YrrM